MDRIAFAFTIALSLASSACESGPTLTPVAARIHETDEDPPPWCLELGPVRGETRIPSDDTNRTAGQRESESKILALDEAALMHADGVRWELVADNGMKAMGTAFRCVADPVLRAPAIENRQIRLVHRAIPPDCVDLGSITGEGAAPKAIPSPFVDLEKSLVDLRAKAAILSATHVRFAVKKHALPEVGANGGDGGEIRNGAYYVVGEAFRCDEP